MANTKISQLIANTNPNGNEELVYAYNNTNGKMTLNTMKAFAWTWKQDTLVSWTNIKTINNQSILWAWNIDIQWGGWSGWEWYDAIVDAAGNGDYTTIWAAVDANKRKIYVNNWTYNETEWHFISMSALDKLIIHWQSKTGVVVNVELTSVQTQWSDPYDYPAFLFLDASTSDNTEIDIKNITFNFSVNSDEVSCYMMRVYYKNTWMTSVNLSNCIFNVSNDWSNRMIFRAIWAKNHAKWTQDIYNCEYSVLSNTANMYLEETDSASSDDFCYHKNCYFISKANSSNKWYMHINNAYDCIIVFDKTNMWEIEFVWDNLERCDINTWSNVGASVPMSVKLSNITNCEFRWTHASLYNPIKVWVNSIVPNWATSTAYSVWTQVIHSNTFYQCKTAHTSGDWWEDIDNWETIAKVFIENAVWNIISWWDTMEFNWTIKSNNFSMNDNGDILLPNRCIFEWNFMWEDNDSHNMYVNDHCIVNWNIFWWYAYSNPTSIRYVSTKQNIIVNNIVNLDTDIVKIWTWSAWIVDNNTSWS